MRHSFGHSHLGVFGRVIKKGEICTGDSVSVIQPD
jgi:MOSC domain-containing protein YiiM